jgi:hypothetical protein
MSERKIKFKSSGFAILDVTVGRRALAKHFEPRPRSGPCPDALRIPVIIYGYLDDAVSPDDGTSREFCVIVEKVETP